MDKNTIAGLVIIFLILIGFSYFTRPSKEQVAEMQRKQDSIARVDRLRAQELAAQQQAQKTPANTTAANPLATKSDSIFVQNDTENKIITLENDKISVLRCTGRRMPMPRVCVTDQRIWTRSK